MPLGGAVDHVEVDGVLARLGRGPLAGGGSGGLLGDAPLGPAALLPDELVLEAGGVAGHLGLQLDRLAAAGVARDFERLKRPINNFVFRSASHIPIGVNDISIDLIFTSLGQGPRNRRRS